MSPYRFNAWYIRNYIRLSDLRLKAFDDSGTLILKKERIEFHGERDGVTIFKSQVRFISKGRQGTDRINTWIKIVYLENSRFLTASFTDSGFLGWKGILGGTNHIFDTLKQLKYPCISEVDQDLERVIAELDDTNFSENDMSLKSFTRTPILFLSAEPTDTGKLRLNEEVREIQEKLRLSKMRDYFVFHQRMAVRSHDISQALLDENPRIVHFSGHGTSTGEICLEDKIGKLQPVQSNALSALFKLFSDSVELVILNACYSNKQATAIAEHVKFVIGMNKAIGDKAAIAFSIGFYQALGANLSIEDSYKFGCVQIMLQNIPEHLTPVLIQK